MKKIILILLLSFFSLSAMENIFLTIKMMRKVTESFFGPQVIFCPDPQKTAELYTKLPPEIWTNVVSFLPAQDRCKFLFHFYGLVELHPMLIHCLTESLFESAQRLAHYEKPKSAKECPEMFIYEGAYKERPTFFIRSAQKQKNKFLQNLMLFAAIEHAHNTPLLEQHCWMKADKLWGQKFELHNNQVEIYELSLPKKRSLQDNLILIAIAGARIPVYTFTKPAPGCSRQRISTIVWQDLEKLYMNNKMYRSEMFDLENIALKLHPSLDPLSSVWIERLRELYGKQKNEVFKGPKRRRGEFGCKI